MVGDNGTNSYRPVAAQRALQVLEHLARSGPNTVQEIAHDMGLPRSSLLGLLQVLEPMGYVRRLDGGRYTLGFQILFLSHALIDGLDLAREALSVMRALTDKTGETTHLGILDSTQVVYIQKVESPQSIKLTSWVGRRVPCHSTSLGKVLLAWLEEPERERILRSLVLDRMTPRTLTADDDLRAEFGRVRKTGYAVDNEENEPGVRCIAAPIHDHRGVVIAAISVSGVASRLPESSIPVVAELVVAAGKEISASIGFIEAKGVLSNVNC